MEMRYDQVSKWLRVLFYVGVASLLNSVISIIPFVPAMLTTWVSRGIMIVTVVCMFQLADNNKRYKKAGIFRAVMLGCMLFTALIFASPIMSLAASVCSIIAVYQEYTAHSELVAQMDPKLSGKWHSLFLWGIAAGLLASMGSVIATMFLAMQEMEIVTITAVVVGLLSMPQFVIDAVYILYLKRMLAHFDEKAELR